MSNLEHTKTPWAVYVDGEGETVAVVNAHERLFSRGVIVRPGVGNTRSVSENNANLAFIVRAANSFDALVSALEHCEELFTRYSLNVVNCDELGDEALATIRAALSQAKGDAE